MVSRCKFLFTLALTVLCFFHLLVASPALSGLTLCIGDEEQIGFETAPHACCAPRPDGNAGASLLESGSNSECCLHFVLDDVLVRHMAPTAVSNAATYFAGPVVMGLLVSSPSTSNLFVNGPVTVNSYLTSLLTVVIRV